MLSCYVPKLPKAYKGLNGTQTSKKSPYTLSGNFGDGEKHKIKLTKDS